MKQIYIMCLRKYVSFHFLQALQAGVVWVNYSQPCFNQAPWGGNKRSGIGRELGEWYDIGPSCFKFLFSNLDYCK